MHEGTVYITINNNIKINIWLQFTYKALKPEISQWMCATGIIKQMFRSNHSSYASKSASESPSWETQQRNPQSIHNLPERRFSRALFQKVSQALLVESFTCSLKDLLSGVFTVCAISILLPSRPDAFHFVYVPWILQVEQEAWREGGFFLLTWQDAENVHVVCQTPSKMRLCMRKGKKVREWRGRGRKLFLLS